MPYASHCPWRALRQGVSKSPPPKNQLPGQAPSRPWALTGEPINHWLSEV